MPEDSLYSNVSVEMVLKKHCWIHYGKIARV